MADDQAHNPWETLSSKVHYDNKWITITEHKVIHEGAGEGIYGTVHFKNLAIGILPVDENQNTWLVGQYRYPLKCYSWEIPEGGSPLADSPLDGAKRELREETGISAKKWEAFLEMDLSNSATDEKAIVYLATQLQVGTAAPEPDELLSLKRLPIQEAIQWVHQGKIRDGISVAALLKYQALYLKNPLP